SLSLYCTTPHRALHSFPTRRSSDLSSSDFRHLMSRFYEAATDVLIENDALVDKFVGDQAIGLFVPGIAGPEHARRAINAAQTLLQRTGHRSGEDPWLQVG